MKIFLVSGWAGSGKDTFCDYIVKKFAQRYVKLSFANPLKDIVSRRYLIDRRLLDTQEGKNKKILITKNNFYFETTGRELLINTAKEIRNKDDKFFINQTMETINNLDYDQNVIISDFRFPLEYEEFKKAYNDPIYKLTTIRINRFSKPFVNDLSEFQLENFKFDITFNNKGTKDKLYDIVDCNEEFFV